MPKLSKSGTAEAAPRKQLYRIVRYHQRDIPVIVERGLTKKAAKEWIAQHTMVYKSRPNVERHEGGELYYGYEEDQY